MQLPGLTPKEIYSLSRSQALGGIEGYHVEKKYFDPLKEIDEKSSLKPTKGDKSRKHVPKRANFIDDETKMHQIVPGPGQYPKVDEWPQKRKIKVKYAEKQTYVDEIIKQQKKQKKPAPGSYNVIKTLKEQQDEAKKLAAKKIHVADRISYLDAVQFEANLIPGVGNYNPRKRATTEIAQTQSQSRIKPEDWKKKHELLQKRQLPKSPDMASYHPTTGNSALFENSSKIKHNKNFLGRVERFKTSASGSGLNPAKYAVLQQWRGKDSKKIQRHGLEVLSKLSHHQSVYH